MQMIVKLINAKKGIEIGTFTGYSALCFACGLPDDGVLDVLELKEDFVNIGKPTFEEAGVAHKINIHIGPGNDTLDTMLKDESIHGTYDFAFIDADKESYPDYVAKVLILLRQNGILFIDNSLLHNKVVTEEGRKEMPAAQVMHDLVNDLLKNDAVEVCTIMIADGLTMVRKK